MSKNNNFVKSFKKIYLLINRLLEKYLNKLNPDNLSNIFRSNKVFLGLVTIIILFLSYLSLPNIYNKSKIEIELKSQLLNRFGINFIFSKNIDYKLEHPVFNKDLNGNPQISYIDQFPEPKNMDQGNFLQKLSDALEESKNKIITELPVGSMIIANNHFWLHGRRPFKENKNLRRELLRIRGKFIDSD